MMCFHKWVKWSDLVPSYKNHKFQFRSCQKCGKTQKRDLGYCDGVSSLHANQALEKVMNGDVQS